MAVMEQATEEEQVLSWQGAPELFFSFFPHALSAVSHNANKN